MRFITAFLLFCLLGCKPQDSIGEFPPVKQIEEVDKTDFALHLEDSISKEENLIYCATFGLAWQEIKANLADSLSDFSNPQLARINASHTYNGTLQEDEYTKSVNLMDGSIKVSTTFRKSLPFEESFTRSVKPLLFDGAAVSSFGFEGHHSQARLNFYHHEDEFSLSLLPKDIQHEIILVRAGGDKTFQTMNDCFAWCMAKRDTQMAQANRLAEYDKVASPIIPINVKIPIIAFNLEKVYNQLIGSTFNTPSSQFSIAQAQQRNAFILNESGAKIESEVELTATESVEEREAPKQLLFNKPFFLFLKRKNAQYPYFALYVANHELLEAWNVGEK